ncbi:unnamed protein product [Symbiodinium sp. CCMP2592]|nr:unnamed protein product [Symbiodinium sp. CCMP2592]
MALWRVLGDNGDKSGESSCGILVREGQGLQTPVLGRLSFGAVVSALADSSSSSGAAPSRLRYRLLRGKGPKEGWVSIRCKGKALLAEADRPDLDPEKSTPFPAIGLEKPNLGAASGWASWHGFKRVANFRDVADSSPCSHPIRCRNGKVLRRGMLFRSGHFAAATKEDLAVLQALQLRTYVDLREGRDFEGADAEVHHVLFPPSPSTMERGAPPAVPPGGRRLWCPVTKDLRLRGWTADEKVGTVPESDRKAWTSWWFQRLTRFALAKDMEMNAASHLAAVNRTVLFVNSDELLRALLALTEEKNYPLVFGCVAGKDRTGLLSCLILSALGCDRETIVHDYLKTNEAARHIDACNQVAQHLWWRQLAAESPERWQRMQATLPTLRFDATWPGLDGSERPPAETSPAETADVTRESQSESEALAVLQGSVAYLGTLEYTLDLLDSEGGALAYLDSIGFGGPELERLLAILTV